MGILKVTKQGFSFGSFYDFMTGFYVPNFEFSCQEIWLQRRANNVFDRSALAEFLPDARAEKHPAGTPAARAGHHGRFRGAQHADGGLCRPQEGIAHPGVQDGGPFLRPLGLRIRRFHGAFHQSYGKDDEPKTLWL